MPKKKQSKVTKIHFGTIVEEQAAMEKIMERRRNTDPPKPQSIRPVKPR